MKKKILASLVCAAMIIPVGAQADTLTDPSSATGLFTVTGELRKDFGTKRFDVDSGRVRIWDTSTFDYFQFGTGGFQFVRTGATYFDNMTANASVRFRSSTTTNARDVTNLIMDSTGDAFFPAGNVNIQSGNIVTSGNSTVGGTMSAAIVEIRGAGNDLAESFKVNNPLEQIKAGMIVSIDPENAGEMMLSSSAYDRKVAGVINGAGGLHAGIHLGDIPEAGTGFHQVALTGRVYVKADPSNGVITPGDMLTTSKVPGHAMKVTDHVKAQGAIIGKAMTPVNVETGLVLVLVSLQ